MKTRIVLSTVMLFSLLGAKAQETVETKIFPTNQIIAPHRIEVTFQKTVHILFPSEVRYVDLGSFDIIADKATGAENVVRIKAAVKGLKGKRTSPSSLPTVVSILLMWFIRTNRPGFPLRWKTGSGTIPKAGLRATACS